jgi:hypothetical protein
MLMEWGDQDMRTIKGEGRKVIEAGWAFFPREKRVRPTNSFIIKALAFQK